MAPVTAHAVATTLLVFFLVYAAMMIAFLWFAGRIVIRGLAGSSPADPERVRRGIKIFSIYA